MTQDDTLDTPAPTPARRCVAFIHLDEDRDIVGVELDDGSRLAGVLLVNASRDNRTGACKVEVTMDCPEGLSFRDHNGETLTADEAFPPPKAVIAPTTGPLVDPRGNRIRVLK